MFSYLLCGARKQIAAATPRMHPQMNIATFCVSLAAGKPDISAVDGVYLILKRILC